MKKEKYKVLITDDERDIRELLGDFLEDKGFQFFLAENAFDALAIFKENPDIDIVMSDIRMPGRSGLDLLGDIKQMDEDVVVIMISAVKDIESAISAMSKGAYDYVSKPFKLAEVGIIVDKAIDKRKLTLENREYQRELEKKVAERTEELKNALDELDTTYLMTLESLATALDMRDEETQGHSVRVLQYAMKLAELLGIASDPGHEEHGNFLRIVGLEKEDPLADDLLFGPLAKGGRVTADLDGGRLVFRVGG